MNFPHTFLEILDNATASGLIIFLAATWIGPEIYRYQKKTDRRYSAAEKLTERLFLLLEHCEETNRYFDRLSNTFIHIVKTRDKSNFELFRDKIIPEELQKISILMMSQLPEDMSKIDSVISIYFDQNRDVQDCFKLASMEFNKWHSFVTFYPMGKAPTPFLFDRRVNDIPEFSLEMLEKTIRNLVKSSLS